MKKLVFLSLALFSACLLVLACAPDKKSKLSRNTLRVSIEPTRLGMLNNDQSVELSAILTNAKGEEQDTTVSWHVEPANFGTFEPTTGKKVTFKTSPTETGQGKITADCSGEKATINFSLGVAAIDEIKITGAPGGLNYGTYADLTAEAFAGGASVSPQPTIDWSVTSISGGSNLATISRISDQAVRLTANNNTPGVVRVTASYGGVNEFKDIVIGSTESIKRFIYSDNGLGTAIDSALVVYNDAQWRPTVASKIEITDSTGIDIDPIKSFRFQYTQGTGLSNNYAGVAFNFTSSQDLSEYTTLVFWAKGESGGEKFRVESPSDTSPSNTYSQTFTVTNNWAQYTMNIPVTNMQKPIKTVINFVFDKNNTNGNATVYFDYIYFE